MGQDGMPPVSEARTKFVAPLEQFNGYYSALADLLGVAIELAAPTLEARAQTLRQQHGELKPFDGNLGQSCPNPADVPWFDKRCERVAGGLEFLGRKPEGESKPGASGPIVGSELQLFDDGQLVELSWVGRWSHTAEGTLRSLSLVHAEVVAPERAVRDWDIVQMLTFMSGSLDPDAAADSEMAPRAQRFHTLLECLGDAIGESAERLQTDLKL